MIAAGEPGGSGLAHCLAAGHRVSHFDGEFTQVAVNRLQSTTVIDHNAVSVNTQRRGPDHRAVVGRNHRSVPAHSEIETQMNLLVDLLYVFLDPTVRRP